MRSSATACALACGAALLCGCSLNRTAARVTGGVMQNGMPAYLEDGDVQTGRETLLPAVKLAEAMLKNDPGNAAILQTLAQGNCGYAFMFVEDEDQQRASSLYMRGVEFSKQLLAGRGLLDLDGNADVSKVRGRDDVPAVFWNAFCRAGYVQLNLDKPDAIADINKIDALLDAVIKTDPGYYYNGAHTLKGALYALRPPMMGGNPKLARSEFELAVSGDGANFLPNKLMYAKAYAVHAQEPELFDKLLGEIDSASEDALPAQRLANNVAKLKAKKLMEKKNDLF
jgi:hypothetical protein